MTINHLYIVTHTDLDGVGSATGALLVTGRSPREATIVYAEPYNIHEKLRDIKEYISQGDLLIISDLGPNKESFGETVKILEELNNKGVKIEWYDHHVWPSELVEKAKATGANIIIDTSTCATGVVLRHGSKIHNMEFSKYMEELEAAICAADLWRWDHYLAPRLFRIADTRYEEGKEAWRNRLVEKFVSGTLWDEELEEKLHEYVNLELENFNQTYRNTYVTQAPCRVAATVKPQGPPSNSFIGASLLSRYQADIAVIIRDNGGISLRSKNVDVQQIALKLGGGGHPRAAGAKIRIPLLVNIGRRLLGPRVLSWYAARLVRRVALETGCVHGL